MMERVERVNNDLMRFVRQIRTANPLVRAKLQQDMKQHLESERKFLLGPTHQSVPESLRHYAVTFTEVQWMLDAWIEATNLDQDDRDLKREFLDAATRMLGEMEVLRAPDPTVELINRRPAWWGALAKGFQSSISAPDTDTNNRNPKPQESHF